MGVAQAAGPDFERIARRVLHTAARVKAGDRITLFGRPDEMEFIDALSVEAARIGAPTVVTLWSDEFLYRWTAEAPLDQLKAGLPHMVELFRASDVIIQLNLYQRDPARFKDLPSERVAARRQGTVHLREAAFDGTRRWIGTDFPTPEQARSFGIDFETFNSLFWRAMDVDYEAMGRTCEAVRAALASGDPVRITTAKGTDLRLEVGGRPVMKDDGVIDAEDLAQGKPLCNLPAGEVCVAPVEDSVRGRVVFDLAYWDGCWMHDVEVEFGAGGVGEVVRAADGLETFRDIIASAGGDIRRIGELGIGLNPGVDRATGFVLVDEKFAGTVHLALGANDFLGGLNQTPLHWDILVLKPTVAVGSRVIIRDGELVAGGGAAGGQ